MKNIKAIVFVFVIMAVFLIVGSVHAQTLLSWNAIMGLPLSVSHATSVEYNGYIYEIGGFNSTNNSSTVYYAPINSDGTVGVWNTTTALPLHIVNATSVAYNGYIYEVGGFSSTNNLSTVYYAPINSDGTIGVWNTTTALPSSIGDATSVAYNGYIYEIGGFNSINNVSLSTVYYAPINSNGTVGVWNTTTALPSIISNATSVEYNGFVYEIGGFNGTNNLSTVYYAPINSNGTVGVWNITTALPSSISDATSVEYHGFVYAIGGFNGTNNLSTVYYAPINSDGTVGVWNTTTSLPSGISNATSVEYNGFVYEIGGFNGTNNLSTVYYVRISVGYTILGSNGNIYSFNSNNLGDMSGVPNSVPSKQGVGFAITPNDLGYYILTQDGGIYTFGNAQFYGSVYNISAAPVKTPVAIAVTPDGKGYYVLTTDGGVYTFGDAVFHGSLFNIPSSAIPDRTPVAIAVTPDNGGYYIVTQNGAVYTFGDAQFYGSTYNIPTAPVKTTVAFSLTKDGNGYYLLTADGGVYTFGDAQFYGSMFNVTNPPVKTPVSFRLSQDGLGYDILTSDGGVYTFGDANYRGSVTGQGVIPVDMM